MPVRRDHHRDLDALRAEAGDAPGPFAFDRHSPFEFQAELGEERNGGIERFDHDTDVIHSPNGHVVCSSSWRQWSGDIESTRNRRQLPRLPTSIATNASRL